MSAGKWRVYRTPLDSHQRRPWVVVHSRIWKPFPTWREAYTYADKQARQ